MYLEAVRPSGTSTCCYENISHGGEENFSTFYLNNKIVTMLRSFMDMKLLTHVLE